MYNMYKTFHQADFINKHIKVYFLNKEFLKIERSFIARNIPTQSTQN